MRFIYLSLGIMFLLFVFGQAWQMRTITKPEGITQTVTNSSGVFVVNGTETTLQYGGQNLVFGISLTEGILASVVAIVAFGTAIGIKIFDSGISEFSQKIIFFFAIYMGLWGIFTVFSYDLIIAIPLFGFFIFFAITIIHLLGIIQEINTNYGVGL
jgi:hypothetical protein